MAKIRNKFGESRVVPWLGERLIMDGQTVDVPAEDVYAYTQQEGWDPADDEAQEAHDAAHAAYLEAIAAEQPAIEVVELEAPPGNASRDDWVAYVLEAGLASEEDLIGKGRDEIRDTYDGSN